MVAVIAKPSFEDGYFASDIFNWMSKNIFELVSCLNLPLNRSFFDLVFVAKKFVKSHSEATFFS